mmetsp:Transcript_38276/g.37784  ORF Transcript_38276/g.37784 Transcript_38276/m.37784 type:complete len:109 (-) Transcript_38276:388-714(-)
MDEILELNKKMNETDTEMRKVEDLLNEFKECKDFIDKLAEFRSVRNESEEVSDTGNAPNTFLTQKENGSEPSNSSVSDESHVNEFNYERRIGFDKEKLLALFQDIEEK